MLGSDHSAANGGGNFRTRHLLQGARIARIECDMVMSFVEIRRPSRIAPLIGQLEGRSDVVAEL